MPVSIRYYATGVIQLYRPNTNKNKNPSRGPINQKDLKHQDQLHLAEKLFEMGRAVVTKGHSRRRLGRTIHTLEASVEFSEKESHAKIAEQQYKTKVREEQANDDSPVQNLRNLAAQKKDSKSQ